MKVAVVGSRSINSYEVVKAILSQYKFIQVISGGAKGVDTLAEQYSEESNLMQPLVIHAGPIKGVSNAGNMEAHKRVRRDILCQLIRKSAARQGW